MVLKNVLISFFICSCPVFSASFIKRDYLFSIVQSCFTDLGVHLSVSYIFAFSYCSWGSQGKNTEVVCYSLLQWCYMAIPALRKPLGQRRPIFIPRSRHLLAEGVVLFF